MSNILINENELKFKLGCGIIISGPSGSGKTTLLLRILKHNSEMFEPPPKQVLYCYGEYHPHIPQLEKAGITVNAGVPSEELLKQCSRPLILILDDLLQHLSEKYLTDLYIKKCHHSQIGAICLTQNLFDKNIKVARNNSQYVIILRQPNSLLSVRQYGQQLFPRQLDYFLQSYNESTREPYGYMLIDLHAASNPVFRLRTNIFPDDENKIVFSPKNV